MDAQLIKWDVELGLDVQAIKTQTKYPYCLESVAWDKGQLAIAMGEKEVKYWKFSTADDVVQPQSAPNYYAATIIWKGLQGKIQRISGHPFIDGVVAYSNEFGHVGLCDSFIKNNAVKFSKHHTMENAPFIDWGPNMCEILQREDMEAPLISCGGDGTVHVYNMNSIKTPPVRLCDMMNKLNPAWFNKLKNIDSHRHAMKIDQKSTFIAFGHTNGFLEIYKLKTLKLIYTTDYQRQCITSLAWKHKVYLAAGCRNGQIVVYDMANLDLDSKDDVPMLGQHNCLIEFSLHKESVNSIKWSLHNDKALLASASDDNFVYVWSVDKTTPIAEFNEHRSRVFSIEWNHIDFDVLFSGGQDKFIYEWNFLDFISAPAKKKQTTSTNSLQCTLNVARASENSTSRIKREQYCMSLANKLLDGKVEKAVESIKSMLSADQIQDAIVNRYLSLWDNNNTQKEQRQNIHELLYGDKNDIRRLIELEDDDDTQSSSVLSSEVEQIVKNKHNVKLAMDIMRCHFTTFDQDATNNEASSWLTDWIMLALSPMVSKEKWLDLMYKQAKKMESIKQFHLAAACYIACSHVYDAIEMYKQYDMFREAIVLAKLRLPPADPIISSLFTEWAKVLQKGDQDTLTATW
ncbi:WD40-repeat-containing domain protein [Parasitella parasitica]|nr:WD40-repeat-containing domain protein [Parasitella parasitica]